MKRCPGCKKDLPHGEFARNRRESSGFQSRCKSCMDRYRIERGYKLSPQAKERKRARDREKYLADKDKVWSENLRRKYGIDGDQYYRMLEEQQGGCAICFSPQQDKKLSVDHCHKTGAVRGLLCSDCNFAVGNLHDDWMRAASLAAYLEHKGSWSSITLTVEEGERAGA